MDHWGGGGVGAKGMLAPHSNYWGGIFLPRLVPTLRYEIKDK